MTRSRFSFAVLVGIHLLAGCGGDSGNDQAGTLADAAAARKRAAISAQRVDPPATAPVTSALQSPAASIAPAAAAVQAAPQVRYDLRLRDHARMYRNDVQLLPEHGKGYPDLSIRLLVTTPGRTARDFPTAAICSSLTRCDHRVGARQEGDLPSHTITLSDSATARLSRAGDSVSITPLYIRAPKDTTLTVTLTIEGSQPVVRRISYLASAESISSVPQATLPRPAHGAGTSH